MISKLIGVIDSIEPGLVIIDVNGVCYDVQVSYQTYYQLGKPADNIALQTHMVVREDAQILYGFYSKAEKSMFLELIKINGVGPKLAIGILSGLEITELVTAIWNEDVKTLCKIPGVGKKSAERLVMEMKEKIERLPINISDIPTVETFSEPETDPHRDDAEKALMSLGYKERDAIKAIANVYASGKSVDELIKDALRHLI